MRLAGRLILVVAGIIWLVAATPAAAGPVVKTFYVRQSGSDANPGDSPANAVKTIQRAIKMCTVSGGGYTIYVGPGTYPETVEIGINTGVGALSGTSTLPNSLIGDTLGTYTLDAPGAVIISGGGTRAFGIRLDSRSYWNFTGLTITGETTYGMYIANGSGFTVSRCTIRPPAAGYFGLYAIASNFTLDSNTFDRNGVLGHCAYVVSTTGGSITMRSNRFNMTGASYLSTPFRNGSLLGGLLGGNGGIGGVMSASTGSATSGFSYGLIAEGTSTTVPTNITIEDNLGSDCYLGIYAYTPFGASCSTSVSCNTVTGCWYPVYVYGYSTGPTLVSNTIVTDSYNGCYVYAPSNGGVGGLLQYNITNLLSAVVGIVTNLISNQDPRFTNPALGDFTLMTGSPAIDAGVARGPTIDIVGNPRPMDGDRNGVATYDLGAFESPGPGRLKISSWSQRDQRVIARSTMPKSLLAKIFQLLNPTGKGTTP